MSNTVNIVPYKSTYCKTWSENTNTSSAVAAFYSSSIDFSISFSLRTNSWASLSPMRASSILMIGFSGGESKQMRVVTAPDTNKTTRLNGCWCEMMMKKGPRCMPCGTPRSQYCVWIRKQLTQLRATCTAGFTARQMENEGLDILPGRWCIRSPWPAEVTQRSDSLAGEIVGRKPVIVHHSEGQTGKSVSVLLRTDVAEKKMRTRTKLGGKQVKNMSRIKQGEEKDSTYK